MEKKLYRSTTDKKLTGVCGGLAQYFGMDPSLMRVIMALAVLCTGIGLIAYIVLAFVLPEEPTII